jgi:hypothetical protein
MKYVVWLLAVGLIGVGALVMAGYCLRLTTTSLSYARVNTVENEFLLSLGVFLLALAGSIIIVMRWFQSTRARRDSKTTASS